MSKLRRKLGYEVGQRIDERLKELGKTRTELADFIGKPRQNVTHWIKNGVLPYLEHWVSIEDFLEENVFDIVRNATIGNRIGGKKT